MRESGWKRGWNTERWKGERVSERAEEIKKCWKKVEGSICGRVEVSGALEKRGGRKK